LFISRRDLLASTGFLLGGLTARATTISGALPWRPNAGSPPEPAQPGPWLYLTLAEAAAVEALADRIIPPDSDTPGGKEAGCAVYIDRQLAGPYGRRAGFYLRPPFLPGGAQQGPQAETGPAQQYRAGLAALDRLCRSQRRGMPFVALPDAEKDEILAQMESGGDGAEAQAFFELILKDVREGFFADPIYGGNRNMVGWRMIGFPGARYDYRDWVGRHNENYPLPPVAIMGRQDWTIR